MTWSTTRPSVPGWYWWRYDRTASRLSICDLVLVNGVLMGRGPGGCNLELVDDGEWFGPLLPPPDEGER